MPSAEDDRDHDAVGLAALAYFQLLRHRAGADSTKIENTLMLAGELSAEERLETALHEIDRLKPALIAILKHRVCTDPAGYRACLD